MIAQRVIPVTLLALALVSGARASSEQLDALYGDIVALFREARYEEAVAPAVEALALAEQEYGPLDTNTARYLNILGSLYCMTHQYDQAEPLLARSVHAREQAFGSNDVRVAQALNNVGSLYVKLGRLDEASTPFERALAIYRRTYGSNDLSVATCLNNLAELDRYAGRYDASVARHQQALAMRRAHLSSTDPFVLQSLNNLAEVLRTRGDYARAEEVFTQGIAAAETSPSNRAEAATLLCNLAFLYREQGRYQEAEQCDRKALDYRRAALGDANPDTCAIYNDLGILYQDMGRYRESRAAFDTALAAYTNVFGPDHDRSIRVRKNIAGLSAELGDFAGAEAGYLDVLAARARLYGTNHPAYAAVLNDLGSLYAREGKLPQATLCFETALAIRTRTLGPDHHDVARALNNLARVYQRSAQTSAARGAYDRALAALYACVGTNNADVAHALANQGDLLRDTGDRTSALRQYAAASNIVRATLGHGHPLMARVMRAAGLAHTGLCQYAAAEGQLTQALAIAVAAYGNDHPLCADIRTDLGSLYMLQTNFPQARAEYRAALAAFDAAAASAGGELFAARVREQQQRACAGYLEALARATSANDPSAPADAFAAMELARARAFLAQLHAVHAVRNAGLAADDVQREQNLRLQVEALSQRLTELEEETPTPATLSARTAIEVLLGQRRAAYHALQSELARRYPRYARLVRVAPITLAECQHDVLREGEAMLCYWLDGNKISACLVTPDDAFFDSYEIEGHALTTVIARLRAALDPRHPERDVVTYKELAHTVYKDCVAPFITRLDPAQIDMLYIVPHDELCTVPFESLVASTAGGSFEGLDYMFLRVPVAYVPSARVLRMVRSLEDRSGPGDRRNALLVGDPLYTAPTSAVPPPAPRTEPSFSLNAGAGMMMSALRLRAAGQHDALDPTVYVAADELTLIVPLPATRREVQTISGLLSEHGESVRVCVGSEARESLLKQMDADGSLARNRYLHFATHAVLPRHVSDVHEPALLLSLYGDDADDGFVTLSEILGFTLDADMVTLSACWSGNVEPSAYADGLSGLARAFFCAGSRRVTVSLWSLEDSCSQRMMAEFYRGIEDAATLKALNQAKRAVLREREFAHPCFWSGLVLLGEWR